jgi:hypothetical protein
MDELRDLRWPALIVGVLWLAVAIPAAVAGHLEPLIGGGIGYVFVFGLLAVGTKL